MLERFDYVGDFRVEFSDAKVHLISRKRGKLQSWSDFEQARTHIKEKHFELYPMFMRKLAHERKRKLL